MLLTLLVAFIIAFSIVFFAIPPIISVAELKHLYDYPSEGRKIHTSRTPTLGGIAIFAGFIIVSALLINVRDYSHFNVIIAALTIVFMIGLKDDVYGLSPVKRFIGQILSACILAFFSDIRFTSFHGVLGLYDVPKWIDMLAAIFTIIVIVNAFNLIDGIDGLAGIIGFIVSLTYGVIFYLSKDNAFAIASFALAGSLSAFLYYNITPSRIFMGDTGATIVGFLTAIFSIRFIEIENYNNALHIDPIVLAAPAIGVAILVVPLFDTFRVFFLRIIKRVSPFQADKNHLHHRLLALGLTHLQATLILAIVNVLFIIKAVLLQRVGTFQLMLLLFAFALAYNAILSYLLWRKQKPAAAKAHYTRIRELKKAIAGIFSLF